MIITNVKGMAINQPYYKRLIGYCTKLNRGNWFSLCCQLMIAKNI